MRLLLKPIYIKIPLVALIAILILALLIVTCCFLHNNYTFHNWYLMQLSLDDVEAVYLCYTHGSAATEEYLLLNEDAQLVISLLNRVRLRTEPYRYTYYLGGVQAYRIVLNSGKDFTFSVHSDLENGSFNFNDESYNIGSRDSADSAEAFAVIDDFYTLYQKQLEVIS